MTWLLEVFRLISKLLKNTIQSAKSFVRWMDGTCRMVPPQPGQEDEQQQMRGSRGSFKASCAEVHVLPGRQGFAWNMGRNPSNLTNFCMCSYDFDVLSQLVG